MSENWEEAILKTMKRLGGKDIPLQKIYDGMNTHPLVTPYHEKSWKPGKQLTNLFAVVVVDFNQAGLINPYNEIVIYPLLELDKFFQGIELDLLREFRGTAIV